VHEKMKIRLSYEREMSREVEIIIIHASPKKMQERKIVPCIKKAARFIFCTCCKVRTVDAP
jgi:hypothetical protein